MVLESISRLHLHDPTISLRIDMENIEEVKAAYFVELGADNQNDLISRTENMM